MDAGDLERGFRLGDWVIEPREGRITGHGQSRPLSAEHARILTTLALSHGEVVVRSYLLEQVWPGEHATEERLRTAIRDLRALLGDPPGEPRYILRVAKRGYTLIAHCEPLEAPVAEPGGEGLAPASVAVRGGFVARLQSLVAELRRRHVFKVLGSYVFGMFVLLQGAQALFAPLHLPDWWSTALAILGVVGVPIVAMLAWSYEITEGGIVLDGGDTALLKLPRARRALAPALVAGVTLMAIVTGIAWWRSIADNAQPVLQAAEIPNRSVAVLPFVDMTPGGGNAYVGDGFSEEISTQLAQVPGLRVAARTSAFEFKDRNVDVRRIGEALGVRNVLEGSVRRDGDKLRVTAQLIDTSSGYHRWAGNFDRQWSDVIAIQDEISRAIARALEVVLTPEAERRLRRGDVANLAAYDAYLEGVSALQKSGDLSQLDRAAAHFRKALAIDPDFSRAYAGLCDAGLRRYRRTTDTDDVTVAEAACRRALELDPTREETEQALGKLYLASGRYEQAVAVFKTLAAHRPNDADVYIGLAQALAGENKAADAERAFRKAIEVEPGYWGGYNALAAQLFYSGRASEAADLFRKVVDLVPGSASGYTNLGGSLMMVGRFDEAVTAFRKSLALEASSSAYANLGILYYFKGRYAQAASEYERSLRLNPSDHQVMGSFADVLWLMPGRRAEAAGRYSEAVTLAEEALKVNPSDAMVWSQLAYYSGRAGDAQKAAKARARAEAMGGEDNMYVQYYLALAAVDRGDTPAALEAAQAAQKLGYSRQLLEAEPSLKPLLARNKA